MAVGAGSIKRASKANAEGATTKKAVTEEVQAVVQEEKAAAPVEQAEAVAVIAEQAKPTRKATTRKPAAKKTAVGEAKAEEKTAPATEPIKQKKGNEACHLTEEMPVHLL